MREVGEFGPILGQSTCWGKVSERQVFRATGNWHGSERAIVRKFPTSYVGYAKAQRIAAHSTGVPSPDGTGNQAISDSGIPSGEQLREGFWNTGAEEVFEVNLWTL